MHSANPRAQVLSEHADRLDELAETAALMDDDATATRLRGEATRCREHAMAHLDEAHTHRP